MRPNVIRYHLCRRCSQSIYLLPAEAGEAEGEDDTWRHKVDGEPESDVCGWHLAAPVLVGSEAAL